MKPRILTDTRLSELARAHGTPLYVYDAAVIRQRVAELQGFDCIRYAQKANAHPGILRLLRECGVEVDAVSAGELHNALAAGYALSQIVYTADLFDRRAEDALLQHPVAVNLGSDFMIEQYAALQAKSGGPREITLRINPGFGHGHARKVNTGGETSKHGIWHTQLRDCVTRATHAGLRVHGLHLHIGSGTDFEHLLRVCQALERLCVEATEAGAAIERISSGGGLPIPYREGEPRLDLRRFRAAWLETQQRIQTQLGHAVQLEVEPGRYLVAEAGVLLTEVRGTKQSGSFRYVIVDAGFHTLVRPAMYGAYHQISALGQEPRTPTHAQVVAGPLCESGDVFTVDSLGHLLPQALPELRSGDLLCIHDAGAYGASMASSYNSQPFPAEVLIDG